ncbi:MAG TPA: SDR family oxidoreductase [Ramlibacter sp.]|nr:SDR family oxidoreductase [Ramlibacter sp.]
MSTILVIGASRGIGLEFVRQYREQWDRVFATAREDPGLARIESFGARAMRLDVTDPAGAGALRAQLEGEKIDIAIYVAGVYARGNATVEPAPQEFDRVMHTNVLGAMRLLVRIAPLVEAADGRFAFITSEMGRIGGVATSHGWTYRVSKAALNMAVAAAQHDYPRATLVAINPGWVRTELGGAGAPQDVTSSVAAMRQSFAGLTRRHRGAFLNYDGRRFKSW